MASKTIVFLLFVVFPDALVDALAFAVAPPDDPEGPADPEGADEPEGPEELAEPEFPDELAVPAVAGGPVDPEAPELELAF